MSQDFSPSFERYVQGVERRERPAKRQRIRTTECVMPDCSNPVRRANSYPLCVEHLIRVWKLVEGDTSLQTSLSPGRHMDLPDEPPLTVEEQEARTLAKRAKLREAAATSGWLYVLDTRDGLVKIGWTGRDLYDRLAQYPPTFDLIVSVRGSRADERDVHRSLKLSRRRGREWYEVTPEVVRQINSWIVIANMAAAQHAANRRASAQQKRDRREQLLVWDQDDLKAQPKLLPRFVSLEDFGAHRQSLKATGTEPEGHFRA